MQNLLSCSIFCIVILSNCFLYEARSLFLHTPDSLSKRNFLKSFCAQRCNMGKGGNVCRCNGFHFAGKRTSNPPLLDSQHSLRTDDDLDEQMIYKLLEENNKIRLEPELDENTLAEEKWLLEQIEDLIPQVIEEESRYYDSAYGPVEGDFTDRDV